MQNSGSNPTIFLAFATADQIWADKMRTLLEKQGLKVLQAASTANADHLERDANLSLIAKASVVFVLIGPQTRASKSVDQQVEVALVHATSSPPAGLVAVILPNHIDFSLPFYDPQNVPLRIHDHVSRESAILRKFSLDPDVILSWIEEASRRRQRFPAPFVSFATQSALAKVQWDASVDQASSEMDL